MPKLIYIASPYTHENSEVEESRWREVCKLSSILLNKGYLVFSPIAQCHPIAAAGGLPTTWEFWSKYDHAFIKLCKEVWVLCMEGWDKSEGIEAERRMAASLGIPVRLIRPEDIIKGEI